MEHLKEQIVGITLYEYQCEMCGNFFWMSMFLKSEMNCPHCSRKAQLNGVLPIKDIKFKTNEKTKKNS